MIDSKKEYKYVTGDLSEIIIDGGIMTRRQDKKILRGEDVAFLKEALAERELAIFGRIQHTKDFTRKLSQSQLNELFYNLCNEIRILGIGYDGFMNNETSLAVTFESAYGSYGSCWKDYEREPQDISKVESSRILKKDDILAALENLPKLSRCVRYGCDFRCELQPQTVAGTFSEKGGSAYDRIVDGRTVGYGHPETIQVGGLTYDNWVMYSYCYKGGEGYYDGVGKSWGWWSYPDVRCLENVDSNGFWIENVPPGAVVTPIVQFRIVQRVRDINNNYGGKGIDKSETHYGFVHLVDSVQTAGNDARNRLEWNWSSIAGSIDETSFSYYIDPSAVNVEESPSLEDYENPGGKDHGYTNKYFKEYQSSIAVRPYGAVIDLGPRTTEL